MAVVLVMAAVFALRAYDAAVREVSRAEGDLREGHFIIGRALRPAIKEVWRLEGQQRALQVLDIADERIQRARKVKIAWVSFHPLPPRYQSIIGAPDLARLGARTTPPWCGSTRPPDDLHSHPGPPAHRRDHRSQSRSAPSPSVRAEVRAVLLRAGLGRRCPSWRSAPWGSC